MSELKVGSKVTSVSVSLNEDMSTKEVKIEINKVLGVSNNFYCLDDDYFTKISRTKTFSVGYSRLEKVRIGEESSKTMISIFGKFRMSIDSTSSIKVIENKINREFNKWVNEKIGVYGRAKDIVIKLENKSR